jgi:hypothetical protein
MESKDIIQLALASWGAILSTILGILRLSENYRRIKISLIQISHVEQVQMIIVNTGHRPITIVDLGIRIIRKPYKTPEKGAPILEEDPNNKNPQRLPITLGDGQSYSIFISPEISNYLPFTKYHLEPFVRDAEGREYTTKKMQHIYSPTRTLGWDKKL